MDLTPLAIELLDGLPANRTLGLTVVEAADGLGRVALPVSDQVRNVVGALHSSGIAALADAAALAAVLSVAPDETTARRLQPLGIQARLMFERPVRGTALATCRLDGDSKAAVADLYGRGDGRARCTTVAIIDGDGTPAAARGEFDWVLRLAPRGDDSRPGALAGHPPPSP
jgi:acyl-coenzyme A thioesterase PaaI-like protein